MKNYQLLIFDWDGTLSDSQAQIVGALAQASLDVGLQPPDDRALRDVIGLSLPAAASRLFGEGRADPDEFRMAYRAAFRASGHPHVPLFEGVGPLLAELHAQEFRLAVATGKGRRGLDHDLQHYQLAHLFHDTRCADDAPSKPHPGMVLELLESLNVDPELALVIGDTEYDMEMASRAGVDGLGVATGAHAPERLLEFGALEVLGAVSELSAWLARVAGVARKT